MLALTHYAVQDGIVLLIFLPPLEGWDCRCAPPYQVYVVREVNQTQGFLSFPLSEARIIISSAVVSGCALTVKSLSCPVAGMLTLFIFSACWLCSLLVGTVGFGKTYGF